MTECICSNCGRQFHSQRLRNFCSRSCSNKAHMQDQKIIRKIAHSKKGKTWKSLFGIEKAENLKRRLRIKMLRNQHAEGHIPWNKGRGEYMKGEKNPMFGKTHTDQAREKMMKSWFREGQLPWNIDNGDYIKGEKNPNWQGGITDRLYPDEFSDALKVYVKKRFSYLCAKCGMSEEQSLKEMHIALAVHHIDFNKENNDLSNLIPLCFHCHGRITVAREILVVC